MDRHAVARGVMSAVVGSCLVLLPVSALAEDASVVGRTGTGVTEVTVVQPSSGSEDEGNPVGGNVTRVASVLPAGPGSSVGSSGTSGSRAPLSKTGDSTRFGSILAFAAAGLCLAGAGLVSRRGRDCDVVDS